VLYYILMCDSSEPSQPLNSKTKLKACLGDSWTDRRENCHNYI